MKFDERMINMNISLYDIKPGEKAYVSKLRSNDGIRRRLLDIGLAENTLVECVGKSPMNDPSAYLIRGAVIALRSEDSKNILINKISKPKSQKISYGRH